MHPICVVFEPTDLEALVKKNLGLTEYKILMKIISAPEQAFSAPGTIEFPPAHAHRGGKRLLIDVADYPVDGELKRVVYRVSVVRNHTIIPLVSEAIGRFLRGLGLSA
jgi:hypothetical protein